MLNSKRIIIAIVIVGLLSVLGLSQDDEEKEMFSQLRHTRRINAHGDEFTTMDMSPDKKRLAIGTEKGDVIIWNIETAKLEKQFHQGHPIHEIIFVGNGSVVVAGGNHTGTHNCLFGKLDIATGRFEEWSGAGADSLMYMSLDETTGILATATVNGYITAWDTANGKRKALWDAKTTVLGLAVSGSSVYVSRSDIDTSRGLDDDSDVLGEIIILSVDDPKKSTKTFMPKKVGYATRLRFSPDKKMLAANLFQSDGPTIGFFDSVNSKQIASVEGSLNVRWLGNERVLLSDDEEPLKFCTIGRDGKIMIDEINKGGGFHGSGNPTDVSGQAVSADERFVWHSYKKIGALAQFDLKTKESKLLIALAPFPYAMDVRELNDKTGYVVTAGDDKFVRVWNLSDLSLVREVASDKTPQGVALLADGRVLIYSCSSSDSASDFYAVEISTGRAKRILSLPTPFAKLQKGGDGFIYEIGVLRPKPAGEKDNALDGPKVQTTKLVQASADGTMISEYSFPKGVDMWTTSHNGKWLVVADNESKFTVFDLTTGAKQKETLVPALDPTKIAISNDGRYVFTVEFAKPLKRLDISTGEIKTIASYRPVASSLNLSVDEKFAIIGGSHYDIGVYEIATGKTGFYTRVDASDFYVPQAWMKGNRLIYITDGGVMFDGMLSK